MVTNITDNCKIKSEKWYEEAEKTINLIQKVDDKMNHLRCEMCVVIEKLDFGWVKTEK